MQKEIVKYDEQFKRTVVNMLESGEIASIQTAMKIFNIKGSSIISSWFKKLGKEHLLPKIKMRRLIDEVENYKENPDLYEKILLHME